MRPKTAAVNGISISYEDAGSGPLVVMVMGTGSPGRVWKAHQQPALVRAGYRVVTFDNRGIEPTSVCAEGFAIEDMVADTAALIEYVGGGPAAVVGTSLGARVAQELVLARPDVVRCAVLMAAYGRNTVVQQAISHGERQLYDDDIVLPESYHAAVTAHLNLSPRTLADDTNAQDWLDIIEFSGQRRSPGVRAQLEVRAGEVDRRDAYRRIARPCMVMGFADDRTLPAFLAREVAQVIPGAEYHEVADAGHYGYLERPGEVNRLMIDYFRRTLL